MYYTFRNLGHLVIAGYIGNRECVGVIYQGRQFYCTLFQFYCLLCLIKSYLWVSLGSLLMYGYVTLFPNIQLNSGIIHTRIANYIEMLTGIHFFKASYACPNSQFCTIL